uniref:DUF3307 domain-containing protein n=1 Tax=Rhodopseudomonas palustris (strain ATCC BAA-98 / CGA009) TaxID=258594 RepID=Q6N935_RHOPA|nr:conserved hypothetical protein [Rhodopseudomonas palustris CGA009]
MRSLCAGGRAIGLSGPDSRRHHRPQGPSEGASLILPDLSSSIAVGALIYWMLLLTIKHVFADFIFQNKWMAMGKDAKTGWALPLLAHCSVHLVMTTLLMLILAPRYWYIGVIDFLIHLAIDRLKGFLVATYDVTNQDRWFWWLIGTDQALHHLTGFGLAIVLAANP